MAIRRNDMPVAGFWPSRPGRRMPTLSRIAAYHGLPAEPACVRCKWVAPCGTWRAASRYLERAHIIDRVFDGLDGPQNLAPLCHGCHKDQPIFRPGDEVAALRWFGLPYLTSSGLEPAAAGPDAAGAGDAPSGSAAGMGHPRALPAAT